MNERFYQTTILYFVTMNKEKVTAFALEFQGSDQLSSNRVTI